MQSRARRVWACLALVALAFGSASAFILVASAHAAPPLPPPSPTIDDAPSTIADEEPPAPDDTAPQLGVDEETAGALTLITPAAAPEPPTINNFVPITANEKLFMNGGLPDGPEVYRVDVELSIDGGVTYQPYCTTFEFDIEGSWECTPAPDDIAPQLGVGENTLRASATNVATDETSSPSPEITVILIPPPIATPIPGVLTNDSTPLFSGTAAPEGGSVSIWWIVNPVLHQGLCFATITAGGFWECESEIPVDEGEQHYYASIAPLSISTGFRSITIDTVPPAVPAITSPSVTSTTEPVSAISGTGEPGASVVLFRNGVPVECTGGPIQVDESGAWTCTLAEALTPGEYAFGARLSDAAGNSSSAGVPAPQLLLTVIDPLAPPPPTVETPSPVASPVTDPAEPSEPLPDSTEPPAEEEDTEDEPAVDDDRAGRTPPATDAGGGTGDRSSPTGISTLTNSVPSIQDVVTNPAVLLSATGLGLIFLLLVVFPASLLDGAVKGHYERLFAPLLAGRAGRWSRVHSWLERHPALGATSLAVLAAALMGFLDPDFGFDLVSLRVFLATLAWLVVLLLLSNPLVAAFARERWSARVFVQVRPLALILTVVGVLVSRLLDFSPGFLIGIIVSLNLVAETRAQVRGRTHLVRTAVIFAVGITAWVGYSLLVAGNGGTPQSFGEALGQEFLAATALGGFASLLVILLPLPSLDGRHIFTASKPAWVILYLATLTMFCLLVLPEERNWGRLGEKFWPWIAAFGVFAVICVAFYLVLHLTGEDPEESANEEAASDLDGSLGIRGT